MDIIGLIVGMYTIAYVMVFSHEVGHLIAAKLVGMRTYALSVGNRAVIHQQTRSGFKWKFGLNALRGSVTVDLSDSRWKNIIMYSAGPAVNALFAVVGAALLLNGAGSLLVLFFSAANVGVFIENMIPRGNTDGKNVLNQLRGNKEPLRSDSLKAV